MYYQPIVKLCNAKMWIISWVILKWSYLLGGHFYSCNLENLDNMLKCITILYKGHDEKNFVKVAFKGFFDMTNNVYQSGIGMLIWCDLSNSDFNKSNS